MDTEKCSSYWEGPDGGGGGNTVQSEINSNQQVKSIWDLSRQLWSELDKRNLIHAEACGGDGERRTEIEQKRQIKYGDRNMRKGMGGKNLEVREAVNGAGVAHIK